MKATVMYGAHDVRVETSRTPASSNRPTRSCE